MDKAILNRYKTHPRILELKLSVMHTVFTREYGLEKTAYIFKSICDVNKINWTSISSVINRKDLVNSLSSKERLRFRQEVIFAGLCFGDSRPVIGRKYLGLSRRMMYEYKDNLLDPDNYVTVDWLDRLDYNVAIAGVESYKNDIERFIEALYVLGGVIL